MQVLHDTELWLREQSLESLTADDWREVKARGFSDSQIGRFTGSAMLDVRKARIAAGVTPAYKRVDTCAAEFAAETPYMYSCYDEECEAAPTAAPKVLILGGGPNRIGQVRSLPLLFLVPLHPASVRGCLGVLVPLNLMDG